MSTKHWLMKAEPDSRIVKGKDVKFSVDDFEACGTTPWEGVRNFEARNLMKEMKVGDKVLFYHSNCKNPGVAGFAEVSKEAYPDYTAWDTSHPYFDPKTNKDDPKWYMVEVTFVARAGHFVPLSLFKSIAGSSDIPEGIAYIGDDGAKSIKAMALVNRGRLSVQRVEADTWEVINELATKGGWEEGGNSTGKSKPKATKGSMKGRTHPSGSRTSARKQVKESRGDEVDEPGEGSGEKTAQAPKPRQTGRGKRKTEDAELTDTERPQRSTRARK